MTNPASTRSVPQPDRTRAPSTRPRRRRLALALPVGCCAMACGLLATAAAVDGSAALLVLAAWVLVLALVGLRLTATGSDRQLRHPELVLASLDGDGGIGEPQVIRLVASQAALDAVRRRPRG